MARKGKQGTARRTTPTDPVDVALELAAERDWQQVSLRDVAARAGIGFAEFYRRFPSKTALVAAFMARIDDAVLAADFSELAESSPRDRLFDVIMRRFDALAPHKAAVRSIARSAPRDLGFGLELACGPFSRSLAAMLAAADLTAEGPRGWLRRHGLGLIYLDVVRRWLEDDTPDFASTMAELDKRLRQAEQFLRMLPGRRAAPRGTP